MPPRPKSKTVTAAQCKEFCAVLALGASRQTAANYTCLPIDTVRRLLRTDRAFAEQVARAEALFEVNALTGLQDAIKGGRPRPAAAWVLERRRSADYERQPIGHYSPSEVDQILDRFTEMVLALLSPKDRARLARALQKHRDSLNDDWLFERARAGGVQRAAKTTRIRSKTE